MARIPRDDTERLDWAERNPEKFYLLASSWWAQSGRGAREYRFNWRLMIDDARAAVEGEAE